MTGPDFGNVATGIVADENEWTSSGPRIIRPRRTVTGTVVGLFADTPAAVKVQTSTGEVLCIRLAGPRSKGRSRETR